MNTYSNNNKKESDTVTKELFPMLCSAFTVFDMKLYSYVVTSYNSIRLSRLRRTKARQYQVSRDSFKIGI